MISVPADAVLYASAGVDIHIEVPRVPFHTCPSAAPRAVPMGKLDDPRCAGQVRPARRAVGGDPGARRGGTGTADGALCRLRSQE